MGEVFSLEWKQVNLKEGKLYLTGDLPRVLIVWKQQYEKKWPDCPFSPDSRSQHASDWCS
jgi:hypothetical protein